MAAGETYSGGNFVVTLGGSSVAYLKKFDGLSMEADIGTNDLGPLQHQAKQVTNVKWTPGKATVGTAMGREWYLWMQSALDLKFLRKNGSVVTGNFNHEAQTELSFMNALMTSITFPKLDASSKDACYFECEFEAEQVRWAKASGKLDGGKYGVKQKNQYCSMFSIDVPGLPCNRVTSIDALKWTAAVVPDAIGPVIEYTKHPAKVTVGDLTLSISMADYQPWADAAKSWFIDGNHLDKDEKDITITLLGANMKDQVAIIDLKRCGFKSFKKEPMEANKEGIARFQVVMYVEQLFLKINEYDA